MTCPLQKYKEHYKECNKEECMWWCSGDEECAVKLIAIQLIKIEERI